MLIGAPCAVLRDWELQVVPDEQIDTWQNEEKALHKYCGHAWHLETAVSHKGLVACS